MVEAGIRRVGSCNGIVESAVVISAQHLGTSDLVCNTNRTAIADAGCSLLTFLGSNEDNTVSGTGTIDCCRSILQHRDALDFRGVEIVEGLSTKVLVAVANLYVIRIDVAVNNEQRLLGGRTYLTQ